MRKSAAILCGGRALRFGGRDKAALVVDGRTILERQLAELRRVEALDDIMVVGGSAAVSGTRLVADTVPGSGPLGGIHAALVHASNDAVYVCACDMPNITAPFVARLFEELGDADIAVPETNRGYHPLCAVYTRACLDAVARRLADRRLKVKELFADVRTRVVNLLNAAPGDILPLVNVNTPEEFAALPGHDQP